MEESAPGSAEGPGAVPEGEKGSCAKGYDTAGSFTAGLYRCLDTRRTYGGCSAYRAA